MGLQLTGDQYAIDSLQKAVDNAVPGSNVWLLDRTYNDKEVVISKSVKIKPKDPQTRPLLNTEVKIDASNVSIEGVAFEAVLGTNIVVRDQKGILINNVLFKSYGQKTTGIYLSGEAQATITNSTFDDVFYGLEVNDGSTVVVDKNKFVSTYSPVDFDGTSGGTVQNNDIS